MRKHMGILIACLVPFGASADPSLECSLEAGSQVEIGDCVAKAERAVDAAMEIMLGFARNTAEELDGITGRAVSLPALEAGQEAWSAYRDAQCEYVGSTFGGGSGTGIAISSCRVELGRARIEQLERYIQ